MADRIIPYNERAIAPPGTISQNVPDERPPPYEGDTYNKGTSKPKRKEKPDTSYGHYPGDAPTTFEMIRFLLIGILMVGTVIIVFKFTFLNYQTKPIHECDKYAQLTIKDVPAQCVSYFLED